MFQWNIILKRLIWSGSNINSGKARKMYSGPRIIVQLNLFKDESDRYSDSDLKRIFEDYISQEINYIVYCFDSGVSHHNNIVIEDLYEMHKELDNGISVNNTLFLRDQYKVEVISRVEKAKKMYGELNRIVWLNLFKDERDRCTDSDLKIIFEDYISQEINYIVYCFDRRESYYNNIVKGDLYEMHNIV